MSRLVSYVLVGGLVLAAAAVINTIDVGARQETDFIQISVLAQSQANYGIDENTMTIPAVSIEIIEDAVHDAQANPSVRVITYISLPVTEEKPEDPENEEIDFVEEFELLNDPDHENNGNDDKDKDKNNNSNDQNKDKDKDKDKDDNGNNQDKEKDKDKDKKEDKSGNAQ